MKYAKKWISIDDQVDLLTRGKGLGCNNVDDLKKSLETIGYYRLSAYWFPYKTSSGDGKTVFREGTTFDEIMRTYEFDRRLRLLMFEAVARIEVFLRSRLAYFAAKEDGAFGYPDSARTKLSREYSAAKKSEQYIKHFANAYGDEHDLPPYWMMVECATMGTLELLFSRVSPSARTAVASDLGVKVPVFKNWLSVLRVTRNACCHHSRVWNREWGVCPKIPNAWSWSGVANGRTFAVLSVIYHLLARIGDAAEPWRGELESLFEDFRDIGLDKVGVPSGWRDMTPWSRSE